MPLPAWMQRRRFATGLAITGLSLATLAMTKATEQHNWLGTAEPSKEPAEQPTPAPPDPCPEPATPDPLLGPRTKEPGSWVGLSPVQTNLPIVVMAGHADSQGTASPGTPGYAVDQQNRPPMQPGIRDELFWNREVQAAVVSQGQARGLNIRSYTPPSITIANARLHRRSLLLIHGISRGSWTGGALGVGMSCHDDDWQVALHRASPDPAPGFLGAWA